MQSIICDSCRKQVREPTRDWNYFILKDRAMCIPCKESFDKKITQQMFSKRRYSFTEYKKTYNDTLAKMCR